MSADDRAVGEPERLHPLFLLTGIGGALRGIGGAYAVIAYLAVTGRLGTALFGAAALLALQIPRDNCRAFAMRHNWDESARLKYLSTIAVSRSETCSCRAAPVSIW